MQVMQPISTDFLTFPSLIRWHLPIIHRSSNKISQIRWHCGMNTGHHRGWCELREVLSVPKGLDEIDLKILHEIQADGRITNVELAKRVGISPPPCLRRVKALEDAGYIRGYRALLDGKLLGYDVTVF